MNEKDKATIIKRAAIAWLMKQMAIRDARNHQLAMANIATPEALT